jgi:hypothetical protein
MIVGPAVRIRLHGRLEGLGFWFVGKHGNERRRVKNRRAPQRTGIPGTADRCSRHRRR